LLGEQALLAGGAVVRRLNRANGAKRWMSLPGSSGKCSAMWPQTPGGYWAAELHMCYCTALYDSTGII